MEIRNGTHYGKKPLAELLRRYFPSSFTSRPKQGFVLPVAEWFESGGALNVALRDLLASRDCRLAELLDCRAALAILEEHSKQTRRDGVLWMLLFMELWLRDISAVRRQA